MSTESDLVDVVLRDHRRIDRCFQELSSEGLRSRERRELLDHVIVELVRHAAAEDAFLRPAARDHLPADEADLATGGRQALADAERTMAQLDGLDPHAPAFDGLTQQLVTEVRHHVADVDCQLLPRLRETCPPTLLADLGARMMRLEATAPARPHPLAPDLLGARQLLAPGPDLIPRARAAIEAALA